jgi:7-keto-8-aminopelargonate synthetase-like enzyme
LAFNRMPQISIRNKPKKQQIMAKIKHNNFIDTVDGVFSGAKKDGVLHLYAEDAALNGRNITVAGRNMLHFGTTGYLGLEQDSRLKEAAIDAIRNYGTQFPLSKSYISHPLYAALESKIAQMYGIPPIIMKNSTLGHLGAIPTLVRDEDALILDHQVHWSVQNACQQLKLRGVPVEMVRHSRLDMLEDLLRKHSAKAGRIWYMADGVYSMYGDYAPVEALLELSRKYPQLRLYFDDVHGMSWKGRNGTGFLFDSLRGELPENVVVMSTLSKTFGASGATFFCSDAALRDKIRNFGGPLTFSAQLEPASVAAAIASSDIHLSPEIEELQQGLAAKTALFNDLLSDSALPIVAQNDSPVFFLAMGTPATAYNFTKRLFAEGFYLNVGIYPAVPIKNTGIRITISAHNQVQDIEALSQAMAFHFPKALEATGATEAKVRTAFKMKPSAAAAEACPSQNASLQIQETRTISTIDRTEWNSRVGQHGMLDWDGLAYLEKAFAASPDPKSHMDFYYYTVRDAAGSIVLLAFFTCGLWKDDLLATESVSRHLEGIRKADPLYLTSRVLSLGSIFTEGQHWHIDSGHPLAERAMRLLLDTAAALYEKLEADMLVLRDFDPGTRWDAMIQGQGFFTMDMPESCVLEGRHWETYDEFAAMLTPRSRRHFQEEVRPFEKYYRIEYKETLDSAALERAHQLYCNVHEKNLAVNTFRYPKEVFEAMSDSPNWEFLLLSLKDGSGAPFVGVMFCYKNATASYVPILVGMDYAAGEGFGLYRQLLFQTAKRARDLGMKRIDFGISATFEKRKLGAAVLPKVAYVQSRDNYAMELMQTLQNENR